MPALRILRGLKTTPWASDDLHYLCVALAVLRALQLCCIMPLWIYLYMRKWQGDGVAGGGRPHWCSTDIADNTRHLQSLEDWVNNTGFVVGENEVQNRGGRSARAYMQAYTGSTFAFALLDLSLQAAIWSASSVGTPAEPMGRDRFLRPLLRLKFIWMNLILVALVVLGCMMVSFNRRDAYGCGNNAGKEVRTDFEDTVWYVFFCTILVSQTLELLFWAWVGVHRLLSWMKSKENLNERSKRKRYERALGGCFKCCGMLTCYKAGGGGIAMRGEFSDVAMAMLDFMDDGGTMDLVLSDLYVALKMLRLVQRERQIDCMMQAKQSQLDRRDEAVAGDESVMENFDARQKMQTKGEGKDVVAGETVLTIGREQDGGDSNVGEESISPRRHRQTVVYKADHMCSATQYRAAMRSVLSLSNPDEKNIILEAAHFAKHSAAIYDDIYDQVKRSKIPVGEFLVQHEALFLDQIGLEETSIAYAQFRNGLEETPYCILIDHKWKVIVVAIRGSASLEDFVIDMQLTPASLDEIGEGCEFDGTNEFCHHGVMKRCNWIHADMKCHQILHRLRTEDNSNCRGYGLVITGHSLGAGCATIISVMLRSTYPDLRCYAFCPPGGLLSEGIAHACKGYVTSIVNNADIVPRMSLENMERLRDDALETLARIRVPKMKLLNILSKKLGDESVHRLNDKVLYPKEDVPDDTKFYCNLQRFKTIQCERKESRNMAFVSLFPPGRVLHLMKIKDVELKRGHDGVSTDVKRSVYIPEWAENSDFNEILMAPTVASDHSIESVLKNLQCVASNENDVEDHFVMQSTSQSQARKLGDSVRIERRFVFCSRPNGNKPFIPSSLATIALILAIKSHNMCVFVARTTTMIMTNPESGITETPFNGLGLSAGLWGYMTRAWDGKGQRDDPASYIDTGVCNFYPKYFEVDSVLIASRASALIATVVGGLTMVILWFAACLSYRPCVWRLVCITLLLTTVSEGLVFLFFRSNLCQMYKFDGFEELGLSPSIAMSHCEIAMGGKIGIVAMIMWLLSAVATAYYLWRHDQ